MFLFLLGFRKSVGSDLKIKQIIFDCLLEWEISVLYRVQQGHGVTAVLFSLMIIQVYFIW